MKCKYCGSSWSAAPGLSATVTRCPFCGKPLTVKEERKNEAEAVLKEIADRFGIDILMDADKLTAYFSDMAPLCVKQRKLLRYFAKCGGPEKIAEVIGMSENVQKACIRRIAAEMNEKLLLDYAASQEISEAFLFAMDGARFPEKKCICTQPEAELKSVKLPLTPEEQFQKGEECRLRIEQSAPDSHEGEKAFSWYLKAALREHSGAQYRLGILYRDGVGVQQDLQQAFLWLKKAAALGNDEAKNELKRGVFADIREENESCASLF